MSTGRVGCGKELNYPGYLGQCMVVRVSYLGKVKQGNYHTHVLYTIPNSNYTFPKSCPFIITYPIHHPTLGTQTGRVLPCASINTTLPWISPHFKAFYKQYPVKITLDTGAEISMIKASVAQHVGTVIKKSNQSALHADGITPRVILDETHIMLSRDNIELELDA